MSTLNANLQDSITLTQKDNTIITLNTEKKYVPKDIQLSISVQSGALTVSGGALSKGNGSSSLSANSGFNNNGTYDTTDKVILATTEASGYYKLIANGSGTVNRGAIQKRITTAGWLAADANAVTVTGLDATSETSNNKATPYYVKKSTTQVGSNTAAFGNATITPTSSSQTVILSDGYYPSNRTITINAISSTSAVGTIKSGSATINSVTFGSYNSTNNNFPITGSATIGDATVEAAGYVAPGEGKGTKLGNTATLSATVARVVVGSTAPTSKSLTQSLSKGSVGENETWTNGADSAAAVTNPPESGVFIKVTAAKISSSISSNGKVTTTGYGTTSSFGTATAVTTSITANATNLFVPVKSAATPSITVTNLSGTDAVTVGTLSSDYYPINAINVTASAKIGIGTPGWYAGSGNTSYSNKYATRKQVGKMIAAQFSKSGDTVTCSRAGYVPQGALPQNGTITGGSITAVTTDPGESYESITDNVTIASGGYLKITAGYYSNKKISLATLVPDEATTNGFATFADGMLSGVVAYDSDGIKITGNILTYTGDNATYTITT